MRFGQWAPVTPFILADEAMTASLIDRLKVDVLDQLHAAGWPWSVLLDLNSRPTLEVQVADQHAHWSTPEWPHNVAAILVSCRALRLLNPSPFADWSLRWRRELAA